MADSDAVVALCVVMVGESVNDKQQGGGKGLVYNGLEVLEFKLRVIRPAAGGIENEGRRKWQVTGVKGRVRLPPLVMN